MSKAVVLYSVQYCNCESAYVPASLLQVQFCATKQTLYMPPCVRPFQFFVCAFSALLLPSLCRCRRVCVVCMHSALTYHVTFLHSQLQSGILVEALGPGVTTQLSNACPQQNKVQGMGSHTLLSLLVGFRAFLSLF